MIVDRVGTSDIRRIGAFGSLELILPNYAAVESIKNLVTRIKARYPRQDGLTYTTKVDKSTNTLTINVVKPEDVRRRLKL